LNLLELAMGLSARPEITKEEIKAALTKTLVYDRAGDQHYDTISAFHKSVRGSDPDAALYYLARMLQSGEEYVSLGALFFLFGSVIRKVPVETSSPVKTFYLETSALSRNVSL
jgi:hypothetical protein